MSCRTSLLFCIPLTILALGLWVYAETQDTGFVPDIGVSEPTNFVKVGTLRFPPTGQAQGAFEYDDDGARIAKKIAMDEWSVCASGEGAAPCMAMSVSFHLPFDGKAAIVEGTLEGDTILVRKLRAAREGEELHAFEPGTMFISWFHAIELLKACQVTMAMQTHALDVYLDLKDGRKVRAVEPRIDELFPIIDQTRARCGTFPVGTE